MLIQVRSNGCSQITDVSLVERFEDFLVVLFKASAVGCPFFVGAEEFSVSLCAQFDHFIQLLVESFIVGTDLPNDFVSVQAEDKLWLGANAVVPGDFGGEIGVDLDDFEEAVFAGQFRDVQIGGLALRIPVGAEVD